MSGRDAQQMTFSVTKPLHARLTELRDQMQARKGRKVTFQEVIQELLDMADRGQVTP